MDLEYIQESDVIERYLAATLTQAETDAFEARLLWCADTRRELDLARALAEGLRELPRDAEQTVATRTEGRDRPYLALAATALLSAGLTWFVTAQIGPSGGVETRGVASPAIFELSSVRSSNGVLPIVNVGADDQWTVLVMYPDFDGYEGFELVLERQGAASWDYVSRHRTGVGDEESLGLVVPADHLRPAGSYRVTVHGRRTDNGRLQLAQTLEFESKAGASARPR